MNISEFFDFIIWVFFIFGGFVYLPIILLKECCSLNSLLFILIIQSTIGFILNSLLLIEQIYFNNSKGELLFLIIVIQIIYLLSAIASIILLCKSVKLKKQNIPLTRMKFAITCYSVPLSIFFFLITIIFLSVFLFLFTRKSCPQNGNCNSLSIDGQIMKYIFVYILILPYLNFIFYASLRYLDLNKICCVQSPIYNKKNKLKNNVAVSQTNINIYPTSNIINDQNINTRLCNYESLPDSNEITISVVGNKKFDMDIIFKINEDKIIKINVPSDITVQKLIDYIFKKMNLDNQTSNIEFILKSEILNKTSKDKLSEKLINGDTIIMNDKNNIIQLNKGITYLTYEKI